MQIVVKGESYEFDEDRMSVAEARLIKKNTGMGIASWGEGIQTGDPDALVALIFIAKKRAGEAPRWNDFDDLDLISDLDVVDEDEDQDEGKSDEPAAEGEPGKPAPAAKKTAKTAGKTPSSE